MAQTYFLCNGGNCESRQVNMAIQSSCSFKYYTGSHEPYEEFCDFYEEKIRFTLDSASPVPLRVYYDIDYHFDGTWSSSEDYTMNNYVDIPSGVTYYDYTYYCNIYCGMDMGAGGYGYETQTLTNPVLKPQTTIPDCCLEPTGVTCTLAITGYTVTNCQVRGDSTGSIEVCVSGNSGNAELYVNGNLYVSGYDNACQTVTGLTAGIYTIAIRDSSLCTVQDAYSVLDGEFRTKPFGIVTPADLVAADNPIILSLATGINTINPEYGKSTIEVTGTIDDGDSITITLEYPQSYSAVLTAKYFPNRDDYFLASILKNSVGASVGTNTAAEIAKSIEECLNKDVILSRLYNFRASNQYVYCTAKEYNASLNLNSSTVTTSGNISVTETVAGTTQYDGQISQNYSLYADILVNNTVEYGDTATIDTFKKVAQIELPFSADNIHLFDLAPVLKNFVQTKKVNFAITGSTILDSIISSYMVEYGEKYPLVQNETTKKSRVKGRTSQKFVINSSLDWTEANDMTLYAGSASTSPSGYTTGVKFLDNAPIVKNVNRDSSEFLFFLIPKDYGKTLQVKGDMYFFDGTSLTGETLITVTTGATNVGGVYCLSAGYRELHLEDYEVLTGSTTRKIRRLDFAVWQSDSANTLTYTETRSYRFEIDEMPRRYGVAFLNKLGTWSCFDFNGEIVNNVNFENEKMEVARAVNVDGSSNIGFISNSVYGTKVTKKIAANSGWIDLEHFNFLMELISTNRCYCYTEETQPYLIISSVNYQKSSNDDLYNVDVEFLETLHQNNISV